MQFQAITIITKNSKKKIHLTRACLELIGLV